MRGLDQLGLQSEELKRYRDASPGERPSMLSVLLKAERAVIAVGTEFTRRSHHGADQYRSASWLQLVILRAEHCSSRSRDFVQALKELLTGTTGEGMSREQLDTGELDGLEARHPCKTVDCGAVFLVKLSASADEGAIQPRGKLLFNPESYYEPDADKPAPQSSEVVGTAFSAGCHQALLAAPSEAAKQVVRDKCLTEQVHAAHAFLNNLSEHFSIFGDLAFMRAPQESRTGRAGATPGDTGHRYLRAARCERPRYLSSGDRAACDRL